MNALLLPGNSPRHAQWLEQLRDAMEPHFDKVQAQHYRHWQTGAAMADVVYEVGVAQRLAQQLEPYCIIAKSIGTVIAMQGTVEGMLKPQKLVLLGIPINGGVPVGIVQEWLRHISIPVTILQNTHDPLGSFADVRAACQGIGSKIVCTELPGDTHDYADFAMIARQV